MRQGISILAGLAMLLGMLVPQALYAASAAELLEQARGKSRDLEELKKVLNGPDANMRLATFEVMVDSGDDTMRELAIDAGLTSTDAIMQALALKRVVLAQSALTLSLEIDTSQPQEVQERAQKYLKKNGNLYKKTITDREVENGIFKMSQYRGQVSGTKVSFENSYDKGTLILEDETTLVGPVTLYEGGYSGFIATWRIR